MEVRNDDEPHNLTSITVKYEFEDERSDALGFNSSDIVTLPVGTHQGLTFENVDRQGKTTNGDEIAIAPENYGADDNISLGDCEVNFQGIRDVEESLEEAHVVVKLEKTDCSASEERYRIVSEHEPGKNYSFVECNGSPLEVGDGERIPEGEVIEIGDSSEEELQDPLGIDSLEGFALCQLESESVDNSVTVARNEQPSSGAVEERVFKAFEDAMDDWYSMVSLHGPLKDCEILESAQQLAERFNFEFPQDAVWLEDFKNRQQCKRKRERDRVGVGVSGVETSSEKAGKNILCERLIARIRPSDLKRAVGREPVENRKRTAREPQENREPVASRPSYGGSIERKGNPLDDLEAYLRDWYFSLTSEHKVMIAATILESKAVGVARRQQLQLFRPSKVWLKDFLGRHGIWCTFDEKRSLFKKPEAGLLKYRFDVEFEAWYHGFPTSADSMLDYEFEHGRSPESRLILRKYVSALFDWYAEQSPTVSAYEILKAEAEIAEMAHLPRAYVELVTKFYREWCMRHEQFRESMKDAYEIDSCMLLPRSLKFAASRSATLCNLSRFSPTQFWTKRFLELNGLCYKDVGVVNWYRFDSSYCGYEIFERIFWWWYRCVTADDVQRLGEMLCKLLNQISPCEPETTLKTESDESSLKIAQSFSLQEPSETS